MPATLPVGGLTFASIGLTAVVVGNAYYQKKQFYPSVVYITKSNPSLAAIYLLAFTVVILLGKFLKKVFFGQLRTAEFEQLLERSFYAVTETCLAFTVFRDDFSPKFVSLFTVLLFLKAFHYLTDSRVDFMERSPIITMLFHIRATSLLLLLMMMDILFLNYAFLSTLKHGASVQLVFGFEYAILLTVGLNIGVKYICHSIDLRSENPWENKAVYLLYTELLVGLVKVFLFVIFLGIMIKIHTFPLFIIRPMYLALRSFKNALSDVVQSRRAIHNMNTLYPDATPEELSSVDNVCIICREEMTSGAKKLPCGHIFHSSCLRSWFQRQQTCPTCRMNILHQTVPLLNQGAQQQQQQQQQPAPQAAAAAPPPEVFNHQIQGERRLLAPGNIFAPGFPFGQNWPMRQFAAFPFNQIHQQLIQQQQQLLQQYHQQQQTQEQQQQQQQQPPTQEQAPSEDATAGAAASVTTTAVSSSSSTTTTNSTSSQKTSFPFGPMPPPPPFLPFMPFSIPAPPPPPNFEGLTLEELKKMEGNERTHVEARIKTLKNIQILLDAAAIQLSQYNSVVSSVDAMTSVSNQAVDKKMENLSNTSSSSSPKEEDDLSQESKESVLGSTGTSSTSSKDECVPPLSSFAPTLETSSTMGAEFVEAISRKDDDDNPTAAAAAPIAPAPAPSASSEAVVPPPSASHASPTSSGVGDECDPDDPNEIRRRRLERFSSSPSAEKEVSNAQIDDQGASTPSTISR